MAYFLLVIVGLLCGMMGAMLGLGGSIVLIPALNELLGPRQHLHQAAAMIVNFFAITAGLWGHMPAGAIQKDVVRGLLPGGVLAVLIGVLLSEAAWFQGSGEKYLTALFGVFMLAAAVYNFSPKANRSRPREPVSRIGLRAAVGVGLPSGLVAGLLGVGGGLVAVPLQQAFLGLRLPHAIANSVVMVCGVSLVGALYKNHLWRLAHPGSFEPLMLALVVLPGSIVGGLIGGRLTHRLPGGWLRGLYVLLLVVGGLRQLAYLI